MGRPGARPALGDVVRVADYLVANHLTPAEQKAVVLTGSGTAPEPASGHGTGEAPVCQASWLIEADEDYQDRVGLLGAVRLYDQGFLRL